MGFQSSGGKVHETQKDADDHNMSLFGTGASGAGAGGGFIGGAQGVMLKILLLIPTIMAIVIGALIKLLVKLGVFGKIIQTLFVTGFCLIIFAQMPIVLTGNIIIGAIIGLIPAVAAGAFYSIGYYPIQTRLVSSRGFIPLLKKCFTIMFYGAIIGLIIGFVSGWEQGTTAVVGMYLPFSIAVIYYIWRHKPFFAKDKSGNRKTPVGFFVAHALVLVFFIGVVIVSLMPSTSTIGGQKVKFPYEATVATTVTATIPSMSGGTKIEIPAGSTVTVVGVSNVGTGENAYKMLSVKYNGQVMNIENLDALTPVK